MNRFIHRKSVFVLLSIFIFGLFLRVNNLHDIFFYGHDQARDFHAVFEMLTIPKLKITGPGTDIPGLFAGPLFYYLAAIPSMLFRFNPNAFAILLICINLLGIPLIYILGKRYANFTVGIVAAFLWALSFELSNFSRFISNPSLLPISGLIFFLGLYLFFFEKKQKGLLISIVGYGLATQTEFYPVYLGILYPLFFWLYKTFPTRKTSIYSIILVVLFFSSFVLAEVKFHFMGVQSLFAYLSEPHGYMTLMDSIRLYYSSLARTLSLNIFGMGKSISFILFFLLYGIFLFLPFEKKKKLFLSVWLFATVPLSIFKTNLVGGNFVHSPLYASYILVVAIVIGTALETKKFRFMGILVLLIVTFFQLRLYVRDNFTESFVLGHQPMTYHDEKQVVLYTYEQAHGKPFSICSVSNPLFVNILWSAVYTLNGEKYGYLPFWAGPSQGASATFLQPDSDHVPLRFLIIEPSNQLPEHALPTTLYAENKISRVVEEKIFGKIRVQKRVVDTNRKIRENSKYEEILKRDNRYGCFF
ncbi:MAG: glycosyltransferase family 39 protein [Candidatus Roizmanbacteria bacterium]|nr:glycosyltransferase family 39 protein [Candidatus Roizmanbacteria bacterium]